MNTSTMTSAPATRAAIAGAIKPRVLLVIPCLNEEGAIAGLLDEIAGLDFGFDTLVIDDGSTDRTYEIASGRSRCVRLIHNLGIGGAVQTGIKVALAEGYDFCIQIDGDGQHPPAEIPKLFAVQRASNANLVVGSRFLLNNSFRSSVTRRIGLRIIAALLRGLYRQLRITDPTSGFRLFDRRAMAFCARFFPYDYPEPLTIAWLSEAGLAVAEAPVSMRERLQGVSSIRGFLRPLGYMVRMICLLPLARFQLWPKG
jgi:glycosyltransferase involved in cell wall biosynthesis